MADPEKLPMPAPIVIAPDADAAFGDLDDPFNPRAIALAWVASAREGEDDLFYALCANPKEWDIAEIAAVTDGFGLSSHVGESEDPTTLVNMRLVAGLGDQPVMVAGTMPAEVLNIALVSTDAGWRVWRLGGEPAKLDDLIPR